MANPAIDTDFKIATQAAGTGGLVTLASIGIPNPHPVYKTGVNKVKLGNNTARVLGSPVVEWRWGFLAQAQRDILRTYCTGGSATVYITTVTVDKVSSVPNGAQTFLAMLWWPDPDVPEDPQTGRRLDFVLTFKQLVLQP
jgi:hypothetical protein